MAGSTSTKSWMIPACLTHVDLVCKEITAWLLELDLSEHLFAIELLAREALNNAILHGCDRDPSRRVYCEIKHVEDALLLKVEDDGPGFDWQDYVRKDIADDDHENGRGIQLYRLYADSVEFNPRGNQVMLLRLLERKGS
jgi:serine/threonine-protein kinase RsbW